MPTSRYESYPLPKEVETKEDVIGENRLEVCLGKTGLLKVLENKINTETEASNS